MQSSNPTGLETDPRFPSGPWTGFFLQKAIPGRHLMELRLTFRDGEMTGEGRDWVGPFLIRGRYRVEDGRCRWVKRYLGKHDVFYQGFNEGKGIWGTWDLPTAVDPDCLRGGFHIWPEGMPDPTRPQLEAEADLPMGVEELEVVEDAFPALPVAPGRHVGPGQYLGSCPRGAAALSRSRWQGQALLAGSVGSVSYAARQLWRHRRPDPLWVGWGGIDYLPSLSSLSFF